MTQSESDSKLEITGQRIGIISSFNVEGHVVMRLTTWKRWAILVAILGLIIGAGVFTQRYQVKRLARSVAQQADSAAEKGDFQEAEKLYEQHLTVFPGDAGIQFKYADMLLKVAPSPSRQAAALQLYDSILKRFPGREDVRRRQMELKFAMGRLRDNLREDGAEADLKILLNTPANQNDGNLLFLMGRCAEDGKNDLKAKDWYQAAIKHDAPQKIEAYQRLATLLRDPNRINNPKAADQAIEDMVKSFPDKYLVYLARGRYRRQFNLPDSGLDFQQALKLADNKPEIYLELARIAEADGGELEAKKVLEAGLKKLPAAAELYITLADLESRKGHGEQTVEVLERGLKSAAEKTALRWMLANNMAMSGDTGKLRLQIEELKNSGISPFAVQYLTAHYYANMSDYRKARQILVPLESVAGLRGDFKTRISNLLARCYSQLGEPGLQREAYIRALAANPQDVQAKLGLIDRMVKQGEIDEAIKEYRTLVEAVPRINLPLAQQLIARNLQRPAPQRNWSDVSSAIDAAEKNLPDAVEPLILRAESFWAQDQRALAKNEIAKARSRFPKSVPIRCAQANLLVIERQFTEAQKVLDDAEKDLGDSIDLRLQRAKLSVAKGGPQVGGELNDLSQKLEPFSKPDRRRLLTGLAIEFVRLQDLEQASRVWSRLVEQEPNDIELRLNLLDLALQTANSDEIDKTIKQIEQMEGPDGSIGPICHVQYLIWQAERAIDKDPQEAQRLRTKARILLNELVARRADWSAIPVALAQLEKQELRQAELRKSNLTEREISEKEESIIRYYRRAIELGQRSSTIVRETVKLLFKHKRGSEALDLVNSVPVASQLASDLGRQALSSAVENRDFERAEEIARKAVAAKPTDLQERILLVQILLNRGRQAEAETTIREAVDLAKSDPDPWILLVKFLLLGKQPAKAVQTIKDAETTLPAAQAPVALAQCCTQVGRYFEGLNEVQQKLWYAQARGWYEKALAAHPDDLSVVRRLTEFFVQTKQMAEVEAQLDAILKRGSNPQNAELVAWARRTLALALASSPDPQRIRRALTVLEQPAPGGQGTKALQDPDDLRALARVLDMQKTVEDRKRAIDVLELLVSKSLANTDDRFLLARLEEINGDWPRALAIYRDLNTRTKNTRDLDTLNRRSMYLTQFGRGLLQNHKAGNDQDLMDAQDLADELALSQPDALDTLYLRVDIYRARNQMDKAIELIQTTSHRPDLAPGGLKALATLAEKLDRIDVAEELYRRYAALPNIQDGTIGLALFLSRHGRVNDALDICEPLWAKNADGESIAGGCSEVVLNSNPPSEPAHIERVTRWLEEALKKQKESSFLLVTLANLREHQKRFDDAKVLYQSVINQVPGIAKAPPNTKLIKAMSYNNLAWLMALKDGDGKDALVDINRAIDLMGPVPDFLDTRGVIHLGLNQTRDAIADLETAVKNSPSPSKLFHLAQAYFQANNKERAKQCLREAKAKGLDRIRVGPGGLHSLEQPAYQKLLLELGLS